MCYFLHCSMESVGRPRVSDVRDHVTCGLCRGYLIDAVTVVRCLHTCQYEMKLNSRFEAETYFIDELMYRLKLK